MGASREHGHSKMLSLHRQDMVSYAETRGVQITFFRSWSITG